ncbi:resolvase [Clostridia bacterium]|nr:resolvase [Clostridia bacterium]
MKSGAKKIAAIYCRLSKEDVDKLDAGDESASISNQKLLLMEYACKNEFMIYKIYADDDYSGFSNRPSFKEMLKDAEDGMFNIVLCKHQSRFTRDMEIVEKYIHGYFIQWGIRFISITDNVDTAVRGGKKSRQINGLINEWYCEDLSENVKAVLNAKRQQGQYVGAFVCYGYLKDANDKHKLIIDEAAASVIKEIFSMYLDGKGASAIAQELTTRRVPTPSQHKLAQGQKFKNPNSKEFSVKHGAWSVNTVRTILRNETYIGNMVQGRDKSTSYKTKKLAPVSKDLWVISPNTHAPIIDKKDFDAVQRLIDRKRASHYETLKNKNASAALLAGKVICLDCGSALHRGGMSRDGSVRYLRCQLAKKTRNEKCTPHNVNEKMLERLVEDRVKELIQTTIDGAGGEIAENVFAKVDGAERLIEVKNRQLYDEEQEIRQLQKNILSAYTDKLNGIIGQEDFLIFKLAFEDEKKSREVRLEQLKSEIADCETKLNSSRDLSGLVEKYKCMEVLTPSVINDFIDNIQVGERRKDANEQEVIINWNF